MYRRAPIAFAVAVSVALHAVLAVYWQPSQATDDPLERTLNVALTPRAQPPMQAPDEPPPLAERAEPTGSAVLHEAIPARPAHASAARKEPMPRTSMVITSQTVANAFRIDDVPEPPCTPAEKANIVHRCAHELAIAPEGNLLENLIGDEAGTASFDDDMRHVQTLLAKAEGLAALDANDPVQTALVAQQRAELRREVLTLDDQYRSANLLRLLPMGWKAAKGLRQKLADAD